MSKYIEVTLTRQQVDAAEKEATRRQEVNEAKNLRGRNNAPAKGQKALEMHRLGCIGEIAVASFLNKEKSLFQLKTPVANSSDLSGGIEIKARSKHNYDLLIQLDDKPDKIFVLVTCESASASTVANTARIVGWIHGTNAMRKEWIREFVRGRPCYAVPQSALSPMGSLDLDSTEKARDIELITECQSWIKRKGEQCFIEIPAKHLNVLKWKPDDIMRLELDPISGNCTIFLANERDQSH